MNFAVRTPAPFHGGLDYEEVRSLGLDPLEIADFSSNLNPFFQSEGLLSGICSGAFAYPDAGYSEVRGAVAGFHGVSADCVFAGNGVSEIVHLLCRCLTDGATVLIPSPTFSEYERAAVICGARVIKAPPPCGLRFDAAAISSAVRNHRPDIVFLCNPNNPTGIYLSQSEVEEIIESAGAAVLALDESYADFVETGWDSTPLVSKSNTVILRSLTKFQGLAGVRLGYAVSNPRIISALNGVRPPWNVNSFACGTAEKVFSLPPEVNRESRARLFAARDRLVEMLSSSGRRCLPTDTGFFLVSAPSARALRNKLLKKGVAVRDCSSFGLPSHIRLSARPEPDCNRLLKAWAEIESEG